MMFYPVLLPPIRSKIRNNPGRQLLYVQLSKSRGGFKPNIGWDRDSTIASQEWDPGGQSIVFTRDLGVAFVL